MKKGLPESDIEQCLLDYFNNELDKQEKEDIEEWIHSDPAHSKIYKKMQRDYWHIRWAQKEQAVNTDRARQLLVKEMNKSKRLHLSHTWIRIAVSAAVIIASGIFIIQYKASEKTPLTAQTTIEPSNAQAKLILSTGEEINLATAGTVSREEEGVQVEINGNGEISYRDKGNIVNKKTSYNTIIVPRGGEYLIKLSDGTQIWLNADTELKYPVNFSATERKVYLKGEAYFNVTHNPQKPFIVKSGEYSLQVYGTEFNLNTYHQNNIQAVLVKGSIGFKANGRVSEQRLKPNQIGIANENTGETEVYDTDIYPYIAWKDQDMVFINEPLGSILEKVSRWYDVDIFYQNETLKDLRFYGNMKRYADIGEFLKRLEATSDIRFSIKDRTIIVHKK